jgi:hypothetical protein
VRGCILVLSGLLLSGCITASSKPDTAPQPGAITCTAGPDCDAKWSRALAWVSNNSQWPIETHTDVVIETKPSINSSALPGFKVTKVASGSGSYEIRFQAGCASYFACTPTVEESRAQFAEFVSASEQAQPPQAVPAAPAPPPRAGQKRSSG